MSYSKLYLISDSFSVDEKTKIWAEEMNIDLKIFSIEEWNKKLSNPFEVSHLKLDDEKENVVLPFTRNYRKFNKNRNVLPMNEVEAQAIRNAILEYKGNLTEAAKVLGIGRATLYRKIKQYNIDPDQVRTNKYTVA